MKRLIICKCTSLMHLFLFTICNKDGATETLHDGREIYMDH